MKYMIVVFIINLTVSLSAFGRDGPEDLSIFLKVIENYIKFPSEVTRAIVLSEINAISGFDEGSMYADQLREAANRSLNPSEKEVFLLMALFVEGSLSQEDFDTLLNKYKEFGNSFLQQIQMAAEELDLLIARRQDQDFESITDRGVGQPDQYGCCIFTCFIPFYPNPPLRRGVLCDDENGGTAMICGSAHCDHCAEAHCLSCCAHFGVGLGDDGVETSCTLQCGE